MWYVNRRAEQDVPKIAGLENSLDSIGNEAPVRQGRLDMMSNPSGVLPWGTIISPSWARKIASALCASSGGLSSRREHWARSDGSYWRSIRKVYLTSIRTRRTRFHKLRNASGRRACPSPAPQDDLRIVVESWTGLTENERAGIVALVLALKAGRRDD